MDLQKGYGVMGVLSRRCLVSPKFSGAIMRSTSSVTMPSFVRLGFHPPPGRPQTLNFFVCLSVFLFVTLLNVRDCAPDFAMKALEYRNDFDTVG